MSNWLDFRLIKREADLESVLRHYGVELRRSGKDQYRGRCPIHRGEGRDAFHANTARNVFYCFACGAGGTVLDFIADMERCSLYEAAEKLETMISSYDGLSTPKLLCSSGPTNGRPHRAANGEGFAFARFPFSWANLRNGPEPSRARGFCAAERTLDGEDRSGTWGRRESGLGVQGVSPWRGAGQRPAYLTARFWRGIKNAVRPIRPPPPTRNS